MTTALELPLFERTAPDDPNVQWLVDLLEARAAWMTAADIAQASGDRLSDRQIRLLAASSEGRVAGGQRGYKLTRHMTREEYEHWRNWMTSQADMMRRRVVEADRIWFGRNPV